MQRAAATLAAGLALAAGGCGERAVPPEPPPRPRNLVLVVIDTLRWDHVGCYGYPHPTTPAIDRLAAEGVRYRRAYAQAPDTNASIGSLFTSRYPSEIGIEPTVDPVPAGELLASEALRAAGFRTAAVVSHLLVSRRWGFDQGGS